MEVFLTNDDTKQEVPFKLSDNQDGTYTVDYEAPRSGNHSCTLRYDSVQVPSTPIKFKVQPNVDVSKIKVDGLEPSKYRGRLFHHHNHKPSSCFPCDTVYFNKSYN